MPFRSLLRALCAGGAFLLASVPSGADPSIAPLSASTVAEVGRTRMVAFRTAEPAARDLAPAVAVEHPDLLEVLAPPAVEQGRSLGFLRIRGLRAGETRLTIGDAAMTVRVVPPRSTSESAIPRIVTPATGAVVWGGFTVGVELDEEPFAAPPVVELRLPGGREFAPVRASSIVYGPTRHLAFPIGADALPAGNATLVAVVREAGGAERASEPVEVRVVNPAPKSVLVLEAEDQRDAPRPERFEDEKPSARVDPDASGQQYVDNSDADPAVCFPWPVAETGLFQVMIVARGNLVGGAYPTVGLIVDNADDPATNGCLADERWHRIPLGVPVKLEPGARTLTPYFLNDFEAEGLAARALMIDRIEVLRVEAEPARALPALGAAKGKMAMEKMAAGGPRGSLRIAFANPLDGRALQGALDVKGACLWADAEHVPPPRVTLLVNGKPAGTQRSAVPRFRVDAGAFRPGANTFQLAAELDDGATDESPVHTLTWSAPAAGAVARAYLRFPMHDEAWDPSIRERRSNANDPPERSAAAFASNGSAALTLPADLTGVFDLSVEAFGEEFDGPPNLAVTLDCGGRSTPVGEKGISGGWEPVSMGRVDLPAGPKRLVFAFTNDKFEEQVGDRNLFLQAAVLAQVVAEEDRVAPVARVVYPPDGHSVYALDAVVAEAHDDRELAWVELRIDGKSTGIRLDVERRPGPSVFPLIARGLAPGEHTLSVRAGDAADHEGESAAQRFTVAAAPPERPGPYARAVRLLDRFAYGPEPAELAAVLVLGEQAWLAERLERAFDAPGDAEALVHGEALFPETDDEDEVAGRVIEHVLTTANPARTRFVQWVENHFSTWIRKAGPELEWPEHRTFLRLGVAPFADLLFASARSPAMLRYLDAQESFAHRLNENYAREIMELHTLGVHGGYTQADVTTLASLLTGWTFAEEGDGKSAGDPGRNSFRFDPQLNDGTARSFLGLGFPKAAPDTRYDRARSAIELLAAHPSTAEFIARKLAEHYVRLPAPDGLVQDLAKVFLDTHGDLKSVLAAIAAHPAFWESAAPDKVCAPFDFAVRLSRTCGAVEPDEVLQFCRRAGMGVMDRPTPDGYPEEDSAFTDTNALLQRWRFVRESAEALAELIPEEWRKDDAPWTDARRQAVIDVLAARLTGRLLSTASNQAALDLLAKAAGDRGEIVRQCAAFVAQLPEANLR